MQYIVLTERSRSTIDRVELRQLRSVEAVARHRHFTRAAEELHLAQSALSHQIRRLERELGTPLFERTSRRVTPTEAGRWSPRGPAGCSRRSTALARRSTSCAASCAGGSGSARCCPRATSTSPGCWRGSARPTRGSRSGCGRASPPTCSAGSPPTSSTPRSACWPATAARRLAAEQLSHDEVVAAFAPDRAPADADGVTAADLGQQPIIATRRGSAITTVLERAVRRRRPAAAAGSGERRPVPAALAGRPGLRHRDPAAVAGRPGRTGGRGPPTRPGRPVPVALVWRRARTPHLPPAGSSSSSGASSAADRAGERAGQAGRARTERCPAEVGDRGRVSGAAVGSRRCAATPATATVMDHSQSRMSHAVVRLERAGGCAASRTRTTAG